MSTSASSAVAWRACARPSPRRAEPRAPLMQDRPVLGGNASSEVRMWICGARQEHQGNRHPRRDPTRQPAHQRRRQLLGVGRRPLERCEPTAESYAPAQLRLLRRRDRSRRRRQNAQAPHQHPRLATDEPDLARRRARSSSSTAPATASSRRSAARRPAGAARRRREFNEDIEPTAATARRWATRCSSSSAGRDEPQPFTPPTWAYEFTQPEDLPHRMTGVQGHNFWWIELGGLQDTIADAERIRDDLMRVVVAASGITSRTTRPRRTRPPTGRSSGSARCPASARTAATSGAHTLTQNDIRAAASSTTSSPTAAGRWTTTTPPACSTPAGATIFHPAPSPYGIPYRCLYSTAVPNLLFAGRNISVTHAALSSMRVMATCAIIGRRPRQSTAAAMAVQKRIMPAQVYPNHIRRTAADADGRRSLAARPVRGDRPDRPASDERYARAAQRP